MWWCQKLDEILHMEVAVQAWINFGYQVILTYKHNSSLLLLQIKIPILYFIFSEKYKFEEHGIYAWDVTGDSCSGVRIIQNPDISYICTYNI